MKQSIILGIGTGRCGLASLAKILNHQPDAQCSYEDAPLLPWLHTDGQRVIRERFARFRHFGKAQLLGDGGLVLSAVYRRRHRIGAGRSDRMFKAPSRGCGRRFLQVAGQNSAPADKPLGAAARPRLASRSEPNANFSPIRRPESRRGNPPLLGRVSSKSGRISRPLSRAHPTFRHL